MIVKKINNKIIALNYLYWYLSLKCSINYLSLFKCIAEIVFFFTLRIEIKMYVFLSLMEYFLAR